MPLVTRQANQGNLFNQALEPTDWSTGDLWVDRDNSNLAVNRSGTAVLIALGTLAAGDILFSSGADNIARLAVGTARQVLQTNAGATAPEWAASPQSLMTTQGDVLIASSANTPARLAIGTADQLLRTNSGATAPEWATIAQLWSVLGDYEATVAEASHNFNFTTVDFDDDSELVLIIDLNTAGVGPLSLQFNTIALGNYFTEGEGIIAGTETTIDVNSATSIQLVSSTFMTGSDGTLFCVVNIGMNKGGAVQLGFVQAKSAGQGRMEDITGHYNLNLANLTDIDIIGTSNWNIGARMTLYKVARA